MVFSSVPLYLDPPNWQQHLNQQQLQGSGTGNHDQNHHLLPPPPPMPQPPHQVGMGGGGGGTGTAPPIRPNSMAERARMAKIPPPEAPLKCPRCESTNTKFCYFNNYNLTQPRHFCKTCRRYWTRGGALRNVPVGGGCRRNKRSSVNKSSSGGGGGSSSKSSLSSPTTTAVGGGHMENGSSTGLGPIIPGSGGMTSFMASLQNIAQIGMGNLGLTFGGSLHAPPLGGGIGGITGGGGGDHHHHNHQMDFNPQIQFPNLLGGFEVVPGGGSALYTSSFQNDHHHQHHDDHYHDDNNTQVINVNIPKSCSTMMSPVKMEEAGQGLNLAKQLMGISSNSDNINATGNNQFWAGTTNMWTDLSGLNSSSSSHLL